MCSDGRDKSTKEEAFLDLLFDYFFVVIKMSKRVRPGYYRQDVNKTTWEVPERYRDLKQVGTGAYGTVW